MLFNSYIFIFLFLPVALAGYTLLKRMGTTPPKVWLIGMSLWFYGYFNIGYLTIMVCSILFNYLVYLWMKAAGEGKMKPALVIGVTGNVLLLVYYKYFDFLTECVNAVFKTDIPLKDILLPLGISFFTFQQIGFLADSYRGDVTDCAFIDYALFVSFFPQLIAGPIADYGSMMPQYAKIGPDTGFDRDRFRRGIAVFIAGLASKVLIADTFGKSVDYAYASAEYINSPEALLAILFYALQLYFDFNGYCNMAIGLGALFGIDIPVNFDSPYKSRNIIDFWRRWHITLNKFLTRNVYIPLGGSRKGELRTYVNLMIVFLISGIWHGAGFNFIIWGLMHGVLYVTVRLLRDKTAIKCDKALSHILTFIFICIAWVFFRAKDTSEALTLLGRVVHGGLSRLGDGFLKGFNSGEFWYVLKVLHLTGFEAGRYIVMILYTVVSLTVVFFAPNALKVTGKMRYRTFYGVVLGIIFVWCVLSLSGVSTFLYFNF